MLLLGLKSGSEGSSKLKSLSEVKELSQILVFLHFLALFGVLENKGGEQSFLCFVVGLSLSMRSGVDKIGATAFIEREKEGEAQRTCDVAATPWRLADREEELSLS